MNKISDQERKINYIKAQIKECEDDIKQAKKTKKNFICYAHRLEDLNDLHEELTKERSFI
mgnify:CR=1 FL=1